MSYPEVQLHIDGRWIDKTSSGALPVVNPANGNVLGHFPVAGEAELRDAVSAAQRGFTVWSSTTPLDRLRIISKETSLLRERAQKIARILTLEQGKPRAESLR